MNLTGFTASMRKWAQLFTPPPSEMAHLHDLESE
jgi:hypothetical protein